MTDPRTFSLSPEKKSPQSSDDLKLVSVSSHEPDGAGEDHALGVHLLKKKEAKELEHTAPAPLACLCYL